MIKIIISNKIYLKPPEELIRLLENKYTFQIYEHHAQKYPKVVRQVNKISDDVYCIERGALEFILEWLDKNAMEYTVIDRTVKTEIDLPEPSFTLREDQQQVYDEFNGNCIIQAQGGWGKSIAALSLIYKTKKKALIVCTTTAIRSMWISEIRKWFGIEPGLIGSGVYNIAPPICVGNIQTVQKKARELSKEFGILILDEMHHCPATTFLNVVSSSHASIRVGLSGTLKRKDQMHVIFPGLFGEKIFTPAVNNTIPPVIYRIHSDIELSGNSSIPWATKINAIYDDKRHSLMVAMIIRELEKFGYNILVTSDRVEFSNLLYEVSENSALFTSDTSIEYRDIALNEVYSGKVNKIYATTSIFSEGVSCNPLSALIHTSSTNNESLLYQLVWRIMRIHTNKNTPVVIDIMFSGSLGKKHAKERKSLYLVKGWKVIDTTVDALEQELKLLLQQT